MEETERQRILSDLRAGFDALRHALTGADESLAARRPAPERWSTLECVEHLARAEHCLLERLTTASSTDRAQRSPEREQFLARGSLDRSRRIAAPEAVRPVGAYRTLSDALAAFETERAKAVSYLENFTGDPHAWLTTHPLIPGPVTCYEILLLAAMHPLRHAKQIEDNRAMQEQPKNTAAE